MPEYPRKFIHKGEDYMSYKGVMVASKTYWYHNKQQVSDGEIFLKYGTTYDELRKAQDRMIQNWHESFPRIRNMQEHFEYILKNHIEFDAAVNPSKLKLRSSSSYSGRDAHMSNQNSRATAVATAITQSNRRIGSGTSNLARAGPIN